MKSFPILASQPIMLAELLQSHMVCFASHNLIPKTWSTSPSTLYKISITSPLSLFIEVSCNGLFLHVPSEAPQFSAIFNDTTRKFQLIRRPKEYNLLCRNKHNLGLAYGPILFCRHDYKVVHMFVIDLDLARGNQVYGFEIFSPSLNSWKMSRSRLRCPTGETWYQAEAVYLDGTLHWVRECGDIVAFNVKTEGARVIPMPLELRLKMIEYQDRKPWFGLVKGLVSVVYLSRSEFVSWVLHDYDNCKWACVRTHIPSLSSRNDLYVIFFDDEWAVFRGKNRRSAICMYNVKSNKWKKIEAGHEREQTCYDDDKENKDVYLPFIPTIAEMNTTSSIADHSIISVQVAASPNSRGKQTKRREITQDHTP